MTHTKTFTRRGLRGLLILPEDVGHDEANMQAFTAICQLTGEYTTVARLDMLDGRVLATGALPSEL